MATTQYVGARYVPLFADPAEWSNANAYEPLTIVVHEGNSYTSKMAVPRGVDISNEKYWALTGNYNAQVEQYRREVKDFGNGIKENTAAIIAETTRAKGVETTLAEDIDTERERAMNAESELDSKITKEVETLNISIENETNRATNVETELNNNITKEIKTLNISIENETNRATNVEAELNNNITNGFNDILCLLQKPDTSNIYFGLFKEGDIYEASDKLPWIQDGSSNAKMMFEHNDKLYIITGNNYRMTSDLINFVTYDEPFNRPTNDTQMWNTSVVEIDGKYYYYGAYCPNYSTKITNAVGETGSFKIIYKEFTFNSDDTIPNLGSLSNFNIITALSGSYVDPYFYVMEDGTLLLAIKNEISCKVEIWKGSSFNTLAKLFETPQFGVEAPKLFKIKDTIYCGFDGYSAHGSSSIPKTENSNAPYESEVNFPFAYFAVYTDENFVTSAPNRWYFSKTPYNAKHICVYNLTSSKLKNIARYLFTPKQGVKFYGSDRVNLYGLADASTTMCALITPTNNCISFQASSPFNSNILLIDDIGTDYISCASIMFEQGSVTAEALIYLNSNKSNSIRFPSYFSGNIDACVMPLTIANGYVYIPSK